MPNYRCFIRGDNYPGQIFGDDGIIGFHATVYQRALSSEKAEYKIMDRIREMFDEHHALCEELNSSVTFEEIVRCEMISRKRTIVFHSSPMHEPKTAFKRAYSRSSHRHLQRFHWKGRRTFS
jgi:hypothetical protein